MTLTLLVDPALQLFLPTSRRRREVETAWDGTSSVGHVVQAAGIPLTEVGALSSGGVTVSERARPDPDMVVTVEPIARPQAVPRWSGGFVLDVHLGTLTRRLRLLGVDAVRPDEDGDLALVERANADRRVLLTQDRGLLKRRALWCGAYVRGARPEPQLGDVLDRFAPDVHPWTRCPACNGLVAEVDRAEVAHRLEPGTLLTQDRFARCTGCSRIYWRGAHSRRLDELIRAALSS